MKVPNYACLLLVMVAMSVAACNGEKATENDEQVVNIPVRDTTVVDTITQVPEDGVSVNSPADKPVPDALPVPVKEPEKSGTRPEQPPKQQQTRQEPPAGAPPAAASGNAGAAGTAGILKEGTYRLQSVQGDQLPLVLDMTTDCDTKLLRGVLQLQSGRFQFTSLASEECAGQVKKQEEHKASGNYRLEGNTIFLNVESGEVLGNAIGVVEGSAIRLQQISNDEEQQEVDWVFQQ